MQLPSQKINETGSIQYERLLLCSELVSGVIHGKSVPVKIYNSVLQVPAGKLLYISNTYFKIFFKKCKMGEDKEQI